MPKMMAQKNSTMGMEQFFHLIQRSLFLAMSWYYTRPALYRLGFFIIVWFAFCFAFNYAQCAPPKPHLSVTVQFGDAGPSAPVTEDIPEVLISQEERQRFVKGVTQMMQDQEKSHLSCNELTTLFIDQISAIKPKSLQPYVDTLQDPKGRDIFVKRMCEMPKRPEVPVEPTLTVGEAEPIVATIDQKRKLTTWYADFKKDWNVDKIQEGCDIVLENFPVLPSVLIGGGAVYLAAKLQAGLQAIKPPLAPSTVAGFTTAAALGAALILSTGNQNMLTESHIHKEQKMIIEKTPPTSKDHNKQILFLLINLMIWVHLAKL